MLLGGGVCGSLGVIIFAIWGNKDKWLPEHANNFFGMCFFNSKHQNISIPPLFLFFHTCDNLISFTGWSFVLAVIGAVGLISCSALFLTEANIQHKKLRQLKDSQARFELERSTKA